MSYTEPWLNTRCWWMNTNPHWHNPTSGEKPSRSEVELNITANTEGINVEWDVQQEEEKKPWDFNAALVWCSKQLLFSDWFSSFIHRAISVVIKDLVNRLLASQHFWYLYCSAVHVSRSVHVLTAQTLGSVSVSSSVFYQGQSAHAPITTSLSDIITTVHMETEIRV